MKSPLPLSLCFVGLAAAFALAGCDRATPRVAGPPPAVPVQVAVAEKRDVPRVIGSIGTVQALRTVAVKSQVDGVLAQIHFKEGDDVKVGDPLVTLDRRPFENSLNIARADLANAEATAAQARTDLARYQSLAERGDISPAELLQYTTKNNSAAAAAQAKVAAVANAELQLSYTEIRAPITGRTGQLMVHEGALVRANDNSVPIVTINQIAPIAVAYAVPEAALDELRAAMAERRAAVAVVDPASSLMRGGGVLEFVDNAVDPTTGMIGLKANFPNPDRSLWPGRFVTVTTQVGIDRDAVVVPSQAVQTSQSGSTVYVLKADKTVDLRKVTVSRVVSEITLIAIGLSAGETVVTDGQLRLIPGARAEAKPLAAPPRDVPARSGKN